MKVESALAKALVEDEMTQSELALRSGVSRETICKLSRNRTKCRASLIVALAYALDLPPEALAEHCYEDLPIGPRSVQPLFGVAS